MRHDDRLQKLIANLIAGMRKPEAARAAGYSESFAKVNVYAVVKSPDFQEKLARAKAASFPASAKPSPSASNITCLPSQSEARTAQQMDPALSGPIDDLPLKQQLFRDFYLGQAKGNGTLAAKLAGYSGDDNALGVTAYNLLRTPKIQQSIQQVRNNSLMGANEVLGRLSKQGRGSIADVLDDNGNFDLQVTKERGTDDLLRKVKIRRRIERGKDGSETEFIDHDVEIHNSQSALELMGRHHKLFGDREYGDAPREEPIDVKMFLVLIGDALGLTPPAEKVIDVTPEPRAVT